MPVLTRLRCMGWLGEEGFSHLPPIQIRKARDGESRMGEKCLNDVYECAGAERVEEPLITSFLLGRGQMPV
ncbi:protein of unknown function [Methanoculleus bourgensis]|uniref:Uncharacterized protein n=1 Tax=Methanoculleus bourgensis TaxID=83986 RepID=A0A0X3BIC5_9EURY|nr:protein of unknown function [Methanoculleus bourgensis]